MQRFLHEVELFFECYLIKTIFCVGVKGNRNTIDAFNCEYFVQENQTNKKSGSIPTGDNYSKKQRTSSSKVVVNTCRFEFTMILFCWCMMQCMTRF